MCGTKLEYDGVLGVVGDWLIPQACPTPVVPWANPTSGKPPGGGSPPGTANSPVTGIALPCRSVDWYMIR